MKKDYLERIADALDGGGDFNQNTPAEIGHLARIANFFEQNNGASNITNGATAVTGIRVFEIENGETENSYQIQGSYNTISNLIESGILPVFYSKVDIQSGTSYYILYLFSIFEATDTIDANLRYGIELNGSIAGTGNPTFYSSSADGTLTMSTNSNIGGGEK